MTFSYLLCLFVCLFVSLFGKDLLTLPTETFPVFVGGKSNTSQTKNNKAFQMRPETEVEALGVLKTYRDGFVELIQGQDFGIRRILPTWRSSGKTITSHEKMGKIHVSNKKKHGRENIKCCSPYTRCWCFFDGPPRSVWSPKKTSDS